VSLLVAVLLPALSKARDTSRNVACLSNLRQQGLAVATYAADNNGLVPYQVQDWNGDLPYSGGWTGFDLQKMAFGAPIQLIKAGDIQAQTKTIAGHTDIYYSGAFQCPSQPVFIPPTGYPTLDPNYLAATAAFRDGVVTQVAVSESADSAQTGYQLDIPGPVYTNYAFNDGAGWYYGILGHYPSLIPPCRDSLPYGWNGTYNPGLAAGNNFQQIPGRTRMDDANSRLGVWLVGDGVSNLLPGFSATSGPVFRHSDTSANICYTDGHGQNLRPSQMDGGSYQTSWDARLSINGNGG
jgi:prepilin-type processing-associated H-X9-DG protein